MQQRRQLARQLAGSPTPDTLRRSRAQQSRVEPRGLLAQKEHRFAQLCRKAPDSRLASAEGFRDAAEARRKLQRDLERHVPQPSLRPTMVERKSCGLCQSKFPSNSFAASYSHAVVVRLLRRFGVSDEQLARRGADSNRRTQRDPVCVFCSQFFDPDAPDGLAPPLDASARTAVTFEPFFDSRFPGTRDSAADLARKRGARARANAQQQQHSEQSEDESATAASSDEASSDEQEQLRPQTKRGVLNRTI